MEKLNVNEELNNKMECLKRYLVSLKSVAVAFSSGVDSTFLLKVAHEVLGDRVIAVTAKSCSFPKRELEEAKAFCKKEGIRHFICESEELEIEGFSKNPVNRCYLCKRELFEKIGEIAAENHIENIAEGSNLDDNGDYRPGLQAVAELDIKSPLRYGRNDRRKIFAGFQGNWGWRHGINSPLPVCPPVLFMARILREKNCRWWIGQSSFYWIWAFIRSGCVFMTR